MEINTWATQFRPHKLGMVVGQRQVVDQIRGFIKLKQVPQTILISGPTGSGKTTLARIIAKEINEYTANIDENPDLHDFNIGEEGGKDAIKEIISLSQFLPRNKFRVMLLDEIHTISKAAASALLKPLEETKPHLVWILVTDQPEKLLPTIVGRALHLKLVSPTPNDLVPMLNYIAKKKNVKLSTDQIRSIADAANGQPRLSIQILQSVAQTMSGGDNGDASVNIEKALHEIISQGNMKVAMRLMVCVMKNATGSLLATIETMDAGSIVPTVQIMISLARNYIIDHYGKDCGFNPKSDFAYRVFHPIIQSDKPLPIEKQLQIYISLVNTRRRFLNESGSDKHVFGAALLECMK